LYGISNTRTTQRHRRKPGAYDYRTRADSTKRSAHAHGLAIDVHALDTRRGSIDVARDYARDARRWRAVEAGPGGLRRCIGAPGRRAGRLLRALACRLKLDDRFRLVLTADDNPAHHDHLHVETYRTRPPRPARVQGAGRERRVS
jgi:hypothetical protein